MPTTLRVTSGPGRDTSKTATSSSAAAEARKNSPATDPSCRCSGKRARWSSPAAPSAMAAAPRTAPRQGRPRDRPAMQATRASGSNGPKRRMCPAPWA